MDVFLINEKIENLSQNLKEIKESLWLRKFKKKFSEQLNVPYVVHASDYRVEDGIIYLPLYMIPLLWIRLMDKYERLKWVKDQIKQLN